MFTIKQVIKDIDDPRQSRVNLFEASGQHITFGTFPVESDPNLPPDFTVQVQFYTPEGVLATLDHGVVYVMNDHGKTVDTYRLAGSDWF